ncbi:Cof-type HAD-IIB family hydrolase [Gorillibacterium sp. sgz5001074]|uniref:Cof-type HAD-IIB family hydrolase n=1 Tax=Gorillibacterium sp. sgz5001074 TaxID=3446695 RepID=UPI003F674119
MRYKIAFFDIDGTLVNESKIVPEDAAAAIRELKARGIEPVIATGRAPYFIRKLAAELGIDSYVCLNGAIAVYRGKTMYKRIMSKESIEQLVRLAGEHGHSLVFQGEHAYYTDAEDQFVASSVNSLKVNMPGYDPDFWKSNEIFQMFLHCESVDEEKYQSLPGLKLIRWHPHAMDVLPEDGSKAQGIAALLEKLGYTAHDAVAFGDGLNDKEMLEYVGFGIAMGNAHEELLPYADYVTTHVDEGGIRNGLVAAGLLEE